MDEHVDALFCESIGVGDQISEIPECIAMNRIGWISALKRG
jgi:hypothetical protein